MNCKICGKVRDYGYKIFCRSCYLKERRKKLRGLKWGKPGIEAFKKARNKCERCSSTTRLQIHHIDGKGSTTPTKKQNNKLENLIIVCPKCHYFLHKASGLNRLGRKTLKENGIWATNHSCCVVCKTIKIKHNCKGLCNLCFERTRLEYKAKKQLGYDRDRRARIKAQKEVDKSLAIF